MKYLHSRDSKCHRPRPEGGGFFVEIKSQREAPEDIAKRDRRFQAEGLTAFYCPRRILSACLEFVILTPSKTVVASVA